VITPAERIADMEHHVYGCYNAAGDLLYVGFSYDVPARIRTHSGRQSWMPEVTRVEILAAAPNRVEGEREEERLIAQLRPICNKRIPTPEREWDLDLYLRQIEADCMAIDRRLWFMDRFPDHSRRLVAQVRKRYGISLPVTGRQAVLDAVRELRTGASESTTARVPIQDAA
jgi:hypothetical protein